jgi:hypothetical protein
MKSPAVAALLVCLPVAVARAGEPAASPPSGTAPLAERPVGGPGRTATAILADVVKAMGSEAAWKAHKNVRMKLEMTFQGMGISGTGERFATKEDKALVVTDLPGMGTIREGSNGKIHWAQDPINGARQLTGAEAEQARLEAVWNPELRVKELYKSVEVKPDPGPGLECLVFTPNEAPPVTNCYDAKTHLQVSQKGTRPTPQGDTPFSSTLKDWREVGGLKMPFSVDTQAGPITFTARLSDVKFDQPMAESMFEPPAAMTAPAQAEAPAKPKAKSKAKAPSKATKPK